MAISEFQSKNKYLTIIIGKKKYQFKPTIDKNNVESPNGILKGEFKAQEIKKILSYDGILQTK